MEAAFEFYYNQPQPSSPQTRTAQRQVEALYARYKDPHTDQISVEGVAQFCEDLQVDPGDAVMVRAGREKQQKRMCSCLRDERLGKFSTLR